MTDDRIYEAPRVFGALVHSSGEHDSTFPDHLMQNDGIV